MRARKQAFGQDHATTFVDRFGIWLSKLQIRRWVPSFAGKAVGDFGCGYDASFARTLLLQVSRLTLVDVALAEDLKHRPEVECIEGSLPQALARLAPESLDVALCVSVLEHLAEPELMLRELHRVLRPEGVLLLNVPSWKGKRYLEFSAFRLQLSPAAEMADHKMYYDVSDLWPLLVRAGFSPRRVRCFPHKLGLNTFAACWKG